MLNTQETQPDYAVPPGDVLLEELEALGMSQVELHQRTGISKKTLNQIIKGKAPITPETALKFERVLHVPARLWNNLERQYQEDLARLAARSDLSKDLAWCDCLPLKEMQQRGWLPDCSDKVAQLEAVLSFFGVASIERLTVLWEKDYAVLYRRCEDFQADQLALMCWLRQGEIEAAQLSCADYDKDAFRQTLDEIKTLTDTMPDVFMPALQQRCAKAGVAVVFVPELPNTRVSGATHWLHKETPVIQLSMRYKSNDHLWFTFFHEVGHILLHGKKQWFVETEENLDQDKEQQANEFAAEQLIPAKQLKRFLSRQSGIIACRAIQDFADELGIAAGIVVGRLQRLKHVPHKNCNKLKRYFRFEQIQEDKALGYAIEEGRKSDFVSEEEIFAALRGQE